MYPGVTTTIIINTLSAVRDSVYTRVLTVARITRALQIAWSASAEHSAALAHHSIDRVALQVQNM